MNEFKIKNGLLVSGSITGVTESSSENSAKMASTSWVRNYVATNSGSISSTKTLESFTATAGQTSFTITNGYTPGLLDIYLNGSFLNTSEYTATDGSTLVLTNAASLDDVIDVVKTNAFYVGASPNARESYLYTATASQTTFAATYTPGQVDVFYNGSKLAPAEFTATNGTSVVLATAATSGDVIEIMGWLTGGGLTSTRTLTINGTTYDLSANRSWTISDDTKLPLSGGTLTGPLTATSTSFPQPSLILKGNFDFGALQFGDTSNYVIRAGTDLVGIEFIVGGSQKLLILDNGNVGINRSNPTYKLDVNGTGNFSGALTGTSAVFSTVSSDYVMSLSNVADSSQGLLVRATDNDGDLYLLRLQSSNNATSQTWVDRFTVAKNGVAIFSSSITATAGTFTGDVLSNGVLSLGGGNALLSTDKPHFFRISGGGLGISANNEAIGNQPIYLYTSGSPRLTILANGNVGIGTTPSEKLHIAGASVNVFLNEATSGNYAINRLKNSSYTVDFGVDASGMYLDGSTGSFRFYNGSSQRFVIGSDGAMGFNYPVLGSRSFMFRGLAGRVLVIEAAEAGGIHSLYLRPNPSGRHLISSNYLSGGVYLPLALSGRENDTDFILSNGHIGIGTTPSAWATPFIALQGGTYGQHVGFQTNGPDLKIGTNNYYSGSVYTYVVSSNGAAQLNVGGNSGFQFNLAPAGTAGTTVSFTSALRITSDGSILVGGASSPGINGGAGFYPEGNSRTTLYLSSTTTGGSPLVYFFNPNGYVGVITTNGSSTSYNTTSDYRLKQDLKSFNGLDVINSIVAYDYQWKSDNTRSYGVLAHELADVIPYAVHGEKDDVQMQGVDYSKIVPVLVKAVQELKAENDQLKDILTRNNII